MTKKRNQSTSHTRSPSMSLNTKLSSLYLSRLLSTPRGRAFLLNQVAAAEGSDEGMVFDHLLAHVQDPKLRQLIKLHQEDEKRHEQMFSECLARTGHARTDVPKELRIIFRI